MLRDTGSRVYVKAWLKNGGCTSVHFGSCMLVFLPCPFRSGNGL